MPCALLKSTAGPRSRLTLGEWVAGLAAHDDNHLDQPRRALEGRP
jgi:hypothetical protein